ncbi:MAG: hypothetical protein Q8Q52_00600, partial [Acidimicrobiia bacterium]|nr:hypothetical protein [Acidimicrobiia bacterium]
MPTIPKERVVHPALFIARSDGSSYEDATAWLSRAEVSLGDVTEVGTDSSGIDSVVRRCTFTLRNDRALTILVWTSDGTVAAARTLTSSDTVAAAGTDGEWITLLLDEEPELQGDSFAPKDQTSSFNQFSGSYDPLLHPNREIILRVGLEGDQESGTTTILAEAVGTGDAIEDTFALDKGPVVVDPDSPTRLLGVVYLDGTPTIAYTVDPDPIPATIAFDSPPGGSVAITADYTWYYTLFTGYLGDSIRATGATVECDARDKAKLLQDTVIEAITAYGSAGGTAIQTIIQAILDNNLGVDAPTLVVEDDPSWLLTDDPEPYQPEMESVWDAILRPVAQIGWFLGYRWNSTTNDLELTILDPPVSKAAGSADYVFDYRDDIYPDSDV